MLLPESKKEELYAGLSSVAQGFYDDLLDSYAQKHSELNRGQELKTHNKAARKYLQSKWVSLEQKMAMISGKDLKKAVFAFLTEKYGISLRVNDLIDAMTHENVDSEMIEVLSLFTK